MKRCIILPCYRRRKEKWWDYAQNIKTQPDLIVEEILRCEIGIFPQKLIELNFLAHFYVIIHSYIKTTKHLENS